MVNTMTYYEYFDWVDIQTQPTIYSWVITWIGVDKA